MQYVTKENNILTFEDLLFKRDIQ